MSLMVVVLAARQLGDGFGLGARSVHALGQPWMRMSLPCLVSFRECQ